MIEPNFKRARHRTEKAESEDRNLNKGPSLKLRVPTATKLELVRFPHLKKHGSLLLKSFCFFHRGGHRYRVHKKQRPGILRNSNGSKSHVPSLPPNKNNMVNMSPPGWDIATWVCPNLWYLSLSRPGTSRFFFAVFHKKGFRGPPKIGVCFGRVPIPN